MLFQAGGKSVAIAASRRIVNVVPENGAGPYTEKQDRTIRINLSPALGYLDCHESYLSFRITPKNCDLARPCRMDRSSLSWVKKLTILSSTGAKLEEIDRYNLLSCLMHQQTAGKEYAETVGVQIDSSGDASTRNAAMSHPNGAQYCSGFDCSGILGGETKTLPLPYLQGSLTLEIEMEEFKNCFVGTGAYIDEGTPALGRHEPVNTNCQMSSTGAAC